MSSQYKRIILKISGEILGSRSEGEPIHAQSLENICEEIKAVSDMGVEIGLVVGGGNIFRGLQGADKGIDRTTGDSMGMLATVINGLALMDRLEKMGAVVRVQSAIAMDKLAEPYIQRRAVRHLERGRIVIFVAGTGNPYFSTDTTAALRASEVSAEIILKATKVDGIYDKDPHKHDDAVKFDRLTYMECLEKRLSVMDSTAFSLCMDNRMPILVFDLQQKHSIRTAVSGQGIGTIVT
ncbi:MAG: UMP kinase [Opitutae bacterium]|jgi:uridylate kinase|nr:UMP kinase [Opitutae bacterium]MEC9122735.1 UMP kinase [Verrucomicrobiota bacterium]